MKTNDLEIPEAFVSCVECKRKLHVICVRFLSALWPKGFICDGCLTRKGIKRKPDSFTAEKLTKNSLSEYIETRVNTRLAFL